MRAIPALVFAALLGTAALASSEAQAATIDEVKADIKYDKQMLKDDKKDLKDIRKIRAKWEKARETGNGKLEAKVDTDLADWVRSKLAEGRSEIGEAAEEAGVAGGDTSGKPTSGTLGKPRATAPRPTQTDDQSDLEAERTAQRRLREIAESLKETQETFSSGRAGDALYAAKSEMLEELQKIAAREVSRSEKELAEDEAQLDRLKSR